MGALKHIWRWGSGLVIGLFVVGYVGTLLVYNTLNLMDRKHAPAADEATSRVLTATGTTQRWNMFSPNVGTLSHSPVVVIVMEDGRRIALRSIVEPEFKHWERSHLMSNDEGPEVRAYTWRFHAGDGRIRKYESRAASTEPGWWRVRTTYTRWRAEQWMQANPDQRDSVRRVELWRSTIRHPGYGRELHLESMQIMPVMPSFDPRWTVPIDPHFPMYRP